jgi:hypothetical protein
LFWKTFFAKICLKNQVFLPTLYAENKIILGGIFMTLMDTEKKNLWSSELHAFNVKAGDSRTDRWNETVNLRNKIYTFYSRK